MKRFLKTFSLLIVALLLLVSGVDATLDHLSRAPSGNSLVWYNQKGQAILAYSGEAALSQRFLPAAHAAAPVLLHRG
jgi:hypothetical protein